MLLHQDVTDPRAVRRFAALENDLTKIHKGKYDYTATTYKKSSIPVEVLCPAHGNFFVRIHNHLRGTGCPKCAQQKQTQPFSEFCKKANKIHNSKFKYLKLIYYTNERYVVFRCTTHGVKVQRAAEHLRGKGCRKCAVTHKDTTQTFIKKAQKRHKTLYDYTKVEYRSTLAKVTITCKKHGDFSQLPINHLNGCGCPKCANYGGDGGFNKNKPGLLYYIKITRRDTTEYKIGITNNTVKQRFGYYYRYIQIINSKRFNSGEDCRKVEKEILDTYTTQKTVGTILRSGRTECFSTDIYQGIKHYFK